MRITDETKHSKLKQGDLYKVETRAKELYLQAMQVAVKDIGTEVTMSGADSARLWLLSWQAALVEELIVDVRLIRKTKVPG